MRWLRVALFRFKSLFRAGRLDAETREELSDHYQREVQARIASGLTPEAARRAATLDIGYVDPIVDASRDARGLVWWDALRADVRYAFRQVRKRPGYSVAAILTFAIGIGATAAVFAVIDTILLRPLPYPDSGRLYSIYEINTRGNVGRTRASGLNFSDWRAQAQSFTDMAGHIGTGFTLTGASDPEFTLGQLVTPNLLDVLNVKPAIGRNFLPEEGRAGRHQVVILTHGLWVTRFGADRSVVDTTTVINNQQYVVIGVLPPSFVFPGDTAGDARYRLLTPMVTEGTVPGVPPMNRSSRFLRVVARLKPAVSEETARAEMTTIGRRLSQEYPDANETVSVGMSRLADDVVGDSKRNLIVVLVAVGFLLLIACVNVASLSIARGQARVRELAVRAAIGASRGRLVRQLATESLVLFTIGAALGLALASWVVTALAASAAANVPRLAELTIDARFLFGAGAVSAVVAVLVSVAPAVQVARRGLGGDVISSRGVVTAATSAHRTRAMLIVAQVAVAVVLLAGAGLAIRSMAQVNAAEKGFDPSSAMTFSVVLNNTSYPTAASLRAFIDRANEALPAAASTAIEAVGTTTHLPLAANNFENSFAVEGLTTPPGQDPPIAGVRGVSGRYLTAIGARLIEGRDFTPADTATSQPVVIVTADFARRYVTHRPPIGARLQLGGADGDSWATIVGVIADVRHNGLDKEPRPEVWIPYSQMPDQLTATWFRGVNVVARTSVDPETVLPALRSAMRQLAPGIPLIRAQSLEVLASASTAERRLQTSVLAAFGGIALTLAAVGLFGVLAFYVAQHVPEFGVRLALGAAPSTLLAGVLRRGVILLAAGLAIGLPGAMLLGQGMSTLLYRVPPVDPVALGAVVIILTIITLGACALPARRAMKTDPVTALRTD